RPSFIFAVPCLSAPTIVFVCLSFHLNTQLFFLSSAIKSACIRLFIVSILIPLFSLRYFVILSCVFFLYFFVYIKGLLVFFFISFYFFSSHSFCYFLTVDITYSVLK